MATRTANPSHIVDLDADTALPGAVRLMLGVCVAAALIYMIATTAKERSTSDVRSTSVHAAIAVPAVFRSLPQTLTSQAYRLDYHYHSTSFDSATLDKAADFIGPDQQTGSPHGQH